MPYCYNCGAEINEKADVCINCGGLVKNNISNEIDKGSFGWGVLGFFIPVAGLILWIMWQDKTPKKAKSVGLGALISVICGAVFAVLYIIFVVLVMIWAMNGAMYY